MQNAECKMEVSAIADEFEIHCRRQYRNFALYTLHFAFFLL